MLNDNKLIKEERKDQKNGNTEKSEQLNHRKFGKVLSVVKEIKTQIFPFFNQILFFSGGASL